MSELPPDPSANGEPTAAPEPDPSLGPTAPPEPTASLGPTASPDPTPPPGPTAAVEPTSPEPSPTPKSTASPRPPAAKPDLAHPLYKGAPLEADKGPGLGCFWTQVVILAVLLLVVIPYGVINAWPTQVTAALLIVALVVVLFVSLTTIFLLRLVAADRRARRAPLRSGARPTVGQLE
ncbi:MAG TPA: hypothetical protein VFW92_02300, partial [Candidatus Limnocylindrales bacterium]|nr:hypothetical protein [Candidatus Limnocylindrales bacterium]